MEKFWKYKLDQVAFWVITVGFHIYTATYLVGLAGWWHLLLEIIIRNGLLAIVIYANLDYLVPTYAQHKKFSAYAVGLIACFVFYVLVKNTHDVFLTVYTGREALTFWKYSFYNFSIALFYVTFSMALHLSKEWYFQRERLQRMEIEKLNTELEYLKAQINPHFLFNSLNTVFVQIDQSNARARETLTKFSDMLRYQLYECNSHEILLDQEIRYLKNYIDLQRLRKDKKYKIDFTTSGDWRDTMIAPLLLMPLVENAFKYVSHFPEGNNRVEVSISCQRIQSEGALESRERELIVRVVNSKETRVAGATDVGGIGLKNLRRRLELQYPGKHRLEIENGKSEFDVQLKVTTHV